MRDYISVGEGLFPKLLSVHSCMFMPELYFGFFILHSAKSVTQLVILAEIPVNSASAGSGLVLIADRRAAQAAFRQHANMLSAGCRLRFGLWTSVACDRCMTPH